MAGIKGSLVGLTSGKGTGRRGATWGPDPPTQIRPLVEGRDVAPTLTMTHAGNVCVWGGGRAAFP